MTERAAHQQVEARPGASDPGSSSSPSLDPEVQARIERLRQRRASATPSEPGSPDGADSARAQKPRPSSGRRSIATGTRIAALGVGGTTMFGIVTALAMAAEDPGAATQVDSVAEQPIVVVIHTTRSDVSETGAATVVEPVEAAPAIDPTPIELRAQPRVTTVEVQSSAPVPVASTNGSR